jgi:hypothetical protein
MPMGRGDRKLVRWAKDRRRKHKARQKRKAEAKASARKG